MRHEDIPDNNNPNIIFPVEDGERARTVCLLEIYLQVLGLDGGCLDFSNTNDASKDLVQGVVGGRDLYYFQAVSFQDGLEMHPPPPIPF